MPQGQLFRWEDVISPCPDYQQTFRRHGPEPTPPFTGSRVKVRTLILHHLPADTALTKLILHLHAVLKEISHVFDAGTPFVKTGITEAVFATQLFDGYACFGLPQKTNDLLFAVFAGSRVRHSPA